MKAIFYFSPNKNSRSGVAKHEEKKKCNSGEIAEGVLRNGNFSKTPILSEELPPIRDKIIIRRMDLGERVQGELDDILKAILSIKG